MPEPRHPAERLGGLTSLTRLHLGATEPTLADLAALTQLTRLAELSLPQRGSGPCNLEWLEPAPDSLSRLVLQRGLGTTRNSKASVTSHLRASPALAARMTSGAVAVDFLVPG